MRCDGEPRLQMQRAAHLFAMTLYTLHGETEPRRPRRGALHSLREPQAPGPCPRANSSQRPEPERSGEGQRSRLTLPHTQPYGWRGARTGGTRTRPASPLTPRRPGPMALVRVESAPSASLCCCSRTHPPHTRFTRACGGARVTPARGSSRGASGRPVPSLDARPASAGSRRGSRCRASSFRWCCAATAAFRCSYATTAAFKWCCATKAAFRWCCATTAAFRWCLQRKPRASSGGAPAARSLPAGRRKRGRRARRSGAARPRV
jgi:hypothetical protein